MKLRDAFYAVKNAGQQRVGLRVVTADSTVVIDGPFEWTTRDGHNELRGTDRDTQHPVGRLVAEMVRCEPLPTGRYFVVAASPNDRGRRYYVTDSTATDYGSFTKREHATAHAETLNRQDRENEKK